MDAQSQITRSEAPVAGHELSAECIGSPEGAPARRCPTPDEMAECLDGIDPRVLNPLLFCGDFKGREISADLRRHNASPGAVNSFGQPVIKVSGVRLIGGALQSALLSNIRLPDYDGPPDAGKYVITNAFGELFRGLDPQATIDMARMGVSGFYRSSTEGDHRIHACILGKPMACAEARFLFQEDEPWDISERAMYLQPLKAKKSSAIFPLIGSLHINGRALSEDEEVELGFRYAATPGKNNEDLPEQAHIPVFLQGGRSLLLPIPMPLPVRKTAEGGHEFVDLLDPAAQERGWEVVVPVAFQYVGAGINHYVYHCALKRADGLVHPLREGESILETEEFAPRGVSLVQRHAYAGKAGIFLDQRHQEANSAPTGGLSTWENAVRNDQLLWRHGAYMGAVSVGSIPLVKQSEIEALIGAPVQMSAPEIRIVGRAVFDDTHRLDLLNGAAVDDPNPDVIWPFRALIERDYGTFTESSRDAYLMRLTSNLGKNLSVLLKCGFALAEEQPLMDNLNIYGGLVDCDNYMRRGNRYQVLPLFKGFVEALFKAAAAGGVGRSEFLRSGAWQEFLAQLSQDRSSLPDRLLTQPYPDLQDIAIGLAAEWTKRTTGEEQVFFSLPDLLRKSREDALFQRYALAILSADELEELQKWSDGLRRGVFAPDAKHFRDADSLVTAYVIAALVHTHPTKLPNHGKPSLELLPEIRESAREGTS